MTRKICVLVCVALVHIPSTVRAQDVVPSDEFQLPDLGDVLPLHRGQSAPNDGLLVSQADMIALTQAYDRVAFRLDQTVLRDRESCDVRVSVEHGHVLAVEERLTLRDDLWGARERELMQQVATAQERANRAAERAWWEAPVLWAIVGGAVVGIVWIAASVR